MWHVIGCSEMFTKYLYLDDRLLNNISITVLEVYCCHCFTIYDPFNLSLLCILENSVALIR